MKRTTMIFLTILAVVSLFMVAAKTPPGANEKHPDEFYATESCIVSDPGEAINNDGWTFYKGQKWDCKWVSPDEQVAGTFLMEIMSPKIKHNGQEHTAFAHFHLMSAMHEWVGYRWGTVDKNGSITWVNGWIATPEAGNYWRHIGWLRFDGANIAGWYEEMGMN